MQCLGIDVGSSSIKGAVLHLDTGEIRGITSLPFPEPMAGCAPGHFEVELDPIEAAVREVIRRLLRCAPDANTLFVSSQMGGLVLLDRKGNALSRYISWRDQRTSLPNETGEPSLGEFQQRLGAGIVHALGNELPAGGPLPLLFWLHEHGNLPSGAVPVSVADAVIARLTTSPPRTHVTMALGMVDVTSLTWHEEAIEQLGLDDQVQLPMLDTTLERSGTLFMDGQSIDVFAACGDQQCALKGARVQRGELSINVSTGSQVSQRVEACSAGPFQTRGYFDGDLLQTITHLPAGRSLNVLVELLTELAVAEGYELKQSWGTIRSAVDRVGKTDLNVDLSFFAGPLGTTGCVRGITTENLTVGHLFRAALESMADNYFECAGRLREQRDWSAIVLSGGLPRSLPVLQQMIATRFGLPVRVSDDEETLLGLLELAREILQRR